AWEGSDSPNYFSKDKAFENQNVPLIPATDPERAKMIRSSRWGGNRIELTNLAAGTYTVFLYVWEDNDPETYAIAVNGRQVEARYNSGTAGHWDRLGPWYTTARDGKIVLTSQGGAANFSGIELWQGQYDGLPTTLSEDDLAFFEKRIRPLLAQRCYECHSAEAVELQGELLLDSRVTARRGGTRGPAVVPGDLMKSLLIQAVQSSKPETQMPPGDRLTDAEIGDLERWIERGAPDPRVTATKHVGKQIDFAAAREFWSLRPIATHPVPSVNNEDWPRTEIDRFILAKLEEHGMRPASDADKRTLIRRATYDLTGLPPTPEEVAAFLADESKTAFARVVDRLLESPRYGERWGRNWLDVVRYADTAGDNSDYPIPQMHRYRDWVIEAFNRDLPYDEFVRDQLAGDLRGGQTDGERTQRIIATGYIANSRRFGSRVDDYPQHLTIEDTIDNLGRAFLGLSLSCARCHDHKFDPITTRDYYGLYGVLASTQYPWPGIELDKRQRDLVPLVAPDQRDEMLRQQTARNKEQSRLDDSVKKKKEALKKVSDENKAAAEAEVKEAERLAREHRQLPPLFDTAYAVAEAKERQDAAVQIKGDPTRSGDVVPRHFPAVLGGGPLPDGQDSSGRMELAEWIVSPVNPLPARVMANRIWQHHFGRGIVPTPNDFGKQGKPPTHPELLDYLAVQFRSAGWSVKSLHRKIMLSRTYQMASMRDSQALTEDPTNDWLAGFPRRRLDAEAIRDTLLALGENLDLSPAGPHPFPAQETWDFTQHKPFKAVYESRHRSVYLMTQRIQRHPYLAIFDGADPSTSTAARMISTTPLQALYLLNDPFVHEQSQRIAGRIRSHSRNVEGRVNHAYELLLARPATVDEMTAANEFLGKATKLLHDDASDPREAIAWRAYVRALFRLNEFVYLD
ncbi:MAG TPA: PSD1 and planctomycete cytochrome C domain-containing protein, partial [Planctomycetaceae bacterium]|nr:PSD1 and planctomycete cytochrome C domain-containing protein [Planctomycetaceae bacterium]